MHCNAPSSVIELRNKVEYKNYMQMGLEARCVTMQIENYVIGSDFFKTNCEFFWQTAPYRYGVPLIESARLNRNEWRLLHDTKQSQVKAVFARLWWFPVIRLVVVNV